MIVTLYSLVYVAVVAVIVVSGRNQPRPLQNSSDNDETTHKTLMFEEMKSEPVREIETNYEDEQLNPNTTVRNTSSHDEDNRLMNISEFAHRNSTSLKNIEKNEILRLQITSGFTRDVNLNNKRTQLHRNINSGSSSEYINVKRNMSRQHLLKILTDQDVDLNKTLVEAWNFTKQFLSSGDLNVAQESMKLVQQYLERRRDWIRYMQLFQSNNKSLSDMLLVDGTRLKERVTWTNQMEITLDKLRNVCRLVKKINETDEINFHRYSDSHNYSAGMTYTLDAGSYLNDLEVELRDIEQMWKRYNENGFFRLPLNWSFHFILERKNYLESINITLQEDQNIELKKKDLGKVFQYYVYPSVYVVILVLGVTGNGTLLLMFVRYKEIRTAPNIMVFNLALADIMNLFVNTPLYYVSKYYNQWMYLDGYGCRTFVTFRFLNHAAIELSVVALSAQRYCATVTTLHTKSAKCRLSSRSSTALYILTVWFTALVFALPPSFVFEFRNGVCFPFVKSQIAVEILDIFYFLFFCFVLPITISVFSTLTARRLRLSVRNIPGEVRSRRREVSRYRSARVVTALAIAYAVSHIPRSIWFFLVSFFHLNRRDIKYMYVDEVTNYLMFSNSCLNPLALYIASGTFRRLFKRYLFCVHQNEIHRPAPLERTTTASSGTRLVYLIEAFTTEINNSVMSIKERNIFRKGSKIEINVNQSA